MNRTIAANAGKHYTNGLVKSIIKNPSNKNTARRLLELGINPEKVVKNSGIGFDDLLGASARVVNKAQFQSTALDLPLFFTSPEGKIMTQFKTFAFNQAKLMNEAILGEVKRGNMKPLIQAVAIMPILGEGVKDLRGLLTGKSRDKAGLARIIENMTAVGGLGILGDLWTSAIYNNVAGFIVGPALGDLSNAVEAMVNASQGKPKKLGREIARKVPLPGFQALTGINR